MMKVIQNISEWQKIRQNVIHDQKIGFVPTMGNLHDGHLSLLERAKKENNITVLSIFVNPTQFNDEKDFTRYPRTFEADLELIKLKNIDYIITPTKEILYPDDYRYRISEISEDLRMEGALRPGHFTGMLTVVMKLLCLVQPHCAYFGEKDYQQYQLIKGLAQAFFLNCEIIGCPTIRDSYGLPLSSRNNLLDSQQKIQARLFPKYLHSQGTCTEIEKKLIEHGFQVDYIVDIDGRRFGAVRLGNIRLIDNIALDQCIRSFH